MGKPRIAGTASGAMTQLRGTIDRIIFYNAENGYTVCRFQVEGREDITIFGNFPPVSPGEMMKISGDWEYNPRFGRQFRVDSLLPVLPSTSEGLKKFLSSGLIKGVGPVLAKRMIDKFGEKTLDVLTQNPQKLKKVEGIGDRKLREIKASWAEHEEIREMIIFLQQHRVSTNMATKIYRCYGKRAYTVLKSNPYQLCYDVRGVGFKTADQVALNLGVSPDSRERVKAFICYLMEQDAEKGHVFSWRRDLITACEKELETEKIRAAEALDELIHRNKVIIETWKEDTACYLPFFHQAEEEIAGFLNNIAAFPHQTPPFSPDRTIHDAEKDIGLSFSRDQKTAIKECLKRKILVITGGPGTGKTTVIRALVDVFQKWGKKVLLAAPTGRAAKRLSEATGEEAKTIHRVLEFTPKKGTFRRDEDYPLHGDALIIDEFSMVDVPLMHSLLKAVPPWMRLVLVGDKDQLPSVGPGNLLKDIIESRRFGVVRLNEIFRQERESLIVVNAHRVNRGLSLELPAKGDKSSDFYFISQQDEEKVFETIMGLCTSRIPRKLGIPALSPDIQVISPMYRGKIGVDSLNAELQKRLNPGKEGVKLGNREIRVHDKVMQVRNDYEKEIFNGDIGIVENVDVKNVRLAVDFDGKKVLYSRDDINDIVLAYAISVHKSQGSEYKAVVLPLLTQHFIMLQRNLFYTALTRAKKLSVIVGSFKAFHIAVKNDKPVNRNTRLKEKLAPRRR